ncbi:hypothetical protein JCM19379_06060 [Methyloparacoccus murrellii]
MLKWLTSLFGHPHDENLAARQEDYRRFRELARRHNLVLVKQLPPAALPECGKKLGLYKAGTLILNQDDEIAVAYDYCLHHHRRGGRNLIERILAQQPPAEGTDELRYLQALAGARFSLFRIAEILPHQGARLIDLLTDQPVDIHDMGLQSTGQPGVIVAGRLLDFGDFSMSSGTLIPIPGTVFEARIQAVMRKFWPGLPADDTPLSPALSPAQTAAFEAQILRIALHAEEDMSFYTDMEN